MENEIRLEKIATKDSYWLDCIEDGIQQDISLEENIERHGARIATNVAIGIVGVKELRKLAKAANVIDGTAHHYAHGNISTLSGEDLEEATARRFAHHALKSALGRVNSWSQRNSFFVKRSKKIGSRKTIL